MAYQYRREPLSIEEADRLLNAARSLNEKLCVWGLLETGLRSVFEPYFVLNDAFPYKKRMIQNVVKRVANRARIARPCSPHVLRHTFAVLFVHRGGSTRSLQLILGHDHLSTTELYLNLSPEDVLREFHDKW